MALIKQTLNMKYLLTAFLLLIFLIPADAQSFAYGVKGGLTIGTQKWDNSLNRDPLFRYHGIAFVESAPEDNATAIFAQLGYHIKGSAIRTNATVVQTNQGLRDIPARKTGFEFKNIALCFGGKKKYELNSSSAYYMLGIRADYTIGSNLDEYVEINEFYPIYPFEAGIRKFNYGVTVGGGMEFPLSEYISGILEFTVNPDFSKQYEQPQITNVPSPTPGGPDRTIPERKIVNNTFEISLGIRFLRMVEYID